MARKDTHKLPDPQPEIARSIAAPATTAALARTTDRLLAKAELALREACCLWSDVDGYVEERLETMAQDVLRLRNETVDHVREAYGDRLGEAPL